MIYCDCPHRTRHFSSGSLSGAFYSKVSPTRQWDVNPTIRSFGKEIPFLANMRQLNALKHSKRDLLMVAEFQAEATGLQIGIQRLRFDYAPVHFIAGAPLFSTQLPSSLKRCTVIISPLSSVRAVSTPIQFSSICTWKGPGNWWMGLKPSEFPLVQAVHVPQICTCTQGWLHNHTQ